MSPNSFLIKHASKYPFLVISSTIFGIAGGLFSGISAALIIPVVLEFVGVQVIDIKDAPGILQNVFAFFESFPEDIRLLMMMGAVVLAIIMKNLTAYISSISGSYLDRSLVNGIRLDAINLLLSVDLDFYSKSKQGDIINRLNREINLAAANVRLGIKVLVTSITILFFVAILLLLSWQLTLISTGLLLVAALLNQYFVRLSRTLGRRLRDKSRDYSTKQLEILSGIRLIKTVSSENTEYTEVKEIIKEQEKAQLQSRKLNEIIGPVNEITGILIVLLIIIIGRYLFSAQLEAVAAVLLTYLYTLFKLLPLVSQINQIRSNLANAGPSVEVVAEFLSWEDKPHMKSGDYSYQELKEGISFNQVSFAYPGSEDLVLKGIDIWIPKGKTVALVGASGAGKSTIADLLPRFYDPTGGEITIDGKNIKEYDLKALRQAMGVVSQDTFLFNNSVRYNIAYGLEKVSEAEIIEAAKRANAYEFIVELPKGFDTEIGDRGVMLSGGQRQRLAIARALLRNPDILILDEATSALDTVSERLVQQAIDELCRDRTTLVIAHRLSTVQNAHKIVVLDKGKVVETGTHQELLKHNGYYAQLYSMQFSEQPEAPFEVTCFEEKELQVFQKMQTELSYQARTSLSAMLGSLRLVSDGLVNTSEEQIELIEESYASALSLLRSIEAFEKNSPAELPSQNGAVQTRTPKP